MGQILHACAKTTEAIRISINNSQESLRTLAKKYSINIKTVAKWKKRTVASDAAMGPKNPRSTILSIEEEAVCVAFRKHTLLPLDVIAFMHYKIVYRHLLALLCIGSLNVMVSIAYRNL